MRNEEKKQGGQKNESTLPPDENMENIEQDDLPAAESRPPAGEPGEQELLQAKYDELNDRHLRLMAEYDNYRKRSQRERDEIYPSATSTAVSKFLPVLDNLERAAAFPHADDDFGKGFDMICQSFKDVLASLEVEEIGQVGETFDPGIHNAVMHIEDESLDANVVSAVLQKGYRIGDRIIRYAMVQTAN